jgi:hypothetical protein
MGLFRPVAGQLYFYTILCSQHDAGVKTWNSEHSFFSSLPARPEASLPRSTTCASSDFLPLTSTTRVIAAHHMLVSVNWGRMYYAKYNTDNVSKIIAARHPCCLIRAALLPAILQ